MMRNPYNCKCSNTAGLLAGRLGLKASKYKVAFQSRFGKAKWLEPCTGPTLRTLARTGHEHIDVICPGFTSDCLETLEEINMEVRHAFMEEGGKTYNFIPCLNNEPSWIAALYALAHQNFKGWALSTPFEPELENAGTRELDLGAND